VGIGGISAPPLLPLSFFTQFSKISIPGAFRKKWNAKAKEKAKTGLRGFSWRAEKIEEVLDELGRSLNALPTSNGAYEIVCLLQNNENSETKVRAQRIEF